MALSLRLVARIPLFQVEARRARLLHAIASGDRILHAKASKSGEPRVGGSPAAQNEAWTMSKKTCDYPDD